MAYRSQKLMSENVFKHKKNKKQEREREKKKKEKHQEKHVPEWNKHTKTAYQSQKTSKISKWTT